MIDRKFRFDVHVITLVPMSHESVSEAWLNILDEVAQGRVVHTADLTIDGYVVETASATERLLGSDRYGKRVRVARDGSVYYEQ